jgi:hypothetical protein
VDQTAAAVRERGWTEEKEFEGPEGAPKSRGAAAVGPGIEGAARDASESDGGATPLDRSRRACRASGADPATGTMTGFWIAGVGCEIRRRMRGIASSAAAWRASHGGVAATRPSS